MEIFFSIFGKIMLILGVVIGIILCLIFILLFSPIHYRATVKKEKEIIVHGMVRWLFFIIYCPFTFENGEFQFSIRLFGIRFRSSGREKKKRPEKSGEAPLDDFSTHEAESREEFSENVESDGNALLPQEEGNQILTEKERHEKGQSGHYRETEQSPEERRAEKKEEKKQSKKQSKKTSRKEKRKKRKQKKETFHEEKETRTGKLKIILEKIREKKAWAGDAKAFWQDEQVKAMVCILKDNVIHLLKKIKPKVLKGCIEFGTGDPAGTGQVLGVLSCIYAYCGGTSFDIVPDFEEKKLLGYLYMRGRLSLITLVMVLLRVILNKHWRHFMTGIKELKEAL